MTPAWRDIEARRAGEGGEDSAVPAGPASAVEQVEDCQVCTRFLDLEKIHLIGQAVFLLAFH